MGASVLLGFAALAFGGVHAWARAIAQLGFVALSIVSWRRGERASGVSRAFVAASAILVGFLILQLVPLPLDAVRALSPASGESWTRSIEALPELTPHIDPSRDGAPPLPRESRGLLPSSWRPLHVSPFLGWTQLLTFLTCGLALRLAAVTPRPRVQIVGLVGVGVVSVVVGMVQLATWNGRFYGFFTPYEGGAPAELVRMTGGFVNPDHLALLLGMALPLAAGLLVAYVGERPVPERRGSRRGRESASDVWLPALGWGVASCLLLAGILSTASRAGLVAAGAGVFATWTMLRGRRGEARAFQRQRRRSRRTLVSGETLERLARASFLILLVIGGALYAGASSRATLDARLDQSLSEGAFEGRWERVVQSVPIVGEFPVWGAGVGAWRDVIDVHRRWPLVANQETYLHDDYVEWLVETGAVGAVLTLLFLGAWVRWTSGNEDVPKPFRAGIIGALVAVAIHSAFDFGLRMPANAYLAAMLLGLLGNRNWSAPVEAAATRIPHADAEPVIDVDVGPGDRAWPRLRRAALAAVMVFVAVASVMQLREFSAWRRVHEGAVRLDLAARDPETWRLLGENLRTSGWTIGPPAEEAYRRSIQRRPLGGAAWHGAGMTAFLTPRRARYLEGALAADPTRAAWRIRYAAALERMGRQEEALEQVALAVELDPRRAAHPYVASLGEEMSAELRRAVAEGHRRAIERHPRDARVHQAAAHFHESVGDSRAAAERWLDALELAGDWVGVGNRAARALVDAGEVDRAVAVWEEIRRREPGNGRAYTLPVYVVHGPGEDFEAASAMLELARRRVRRDELPAIWNAEGWLRRRQGDEKAAAEAFERAAALEPRNASFHAMAGASYLREGDAHRAKVAWAKAVARDPAAAAYREGLGRAMELSYDYVGARDAYREAVRLDPDNERYAQRLARVEKSLEEADAF